jgi:hypothetical protein
VTLRWIIFLNLLAVGNVIAAPIDIATGIITGAGVYLLRQDYKDGAEITTFPVWAFLENKTYGAQLVSPGSSEKNESLAVVEGNKQLGFASAVSTGAAALEVGVENNLRNRGSYISFARYYTKLKNNTDQELNLDFHFVVEPGELTIRGIRDGDTAHLRAGGFIDYRLLSPAGPFGGTYDETTGRLYDYYADIDFDDRITGSKLTASFFRNEESLLSLGTERLAAKVSLPTIPGRGELTVYYDMFAHLNVLDFEVGGSVKLGDPTDLVGGAGGRFIERTPTAIPEPATSVLTVTALLQIAVLRRRRFEIAERNLTEQVTAFDQSSRVKLPRVQQPGDLA